MRSVSVSLTTVASRLAASAPHRFIHSCCWRSSSCCFLLSLRSATNPSYSKVLTAWACDKTRFEAISCRFACSVRVRNAAAADETRRAGTTAEEGPGSGPGLSFRGRFWEDVLWDMAGCPVAEDWGRGRTGRVVVSTSRGSVCTMVGWSENEDVLEGRCVWQRTRQRRPDGRPNEVDAMK